jgi:hypothetical protein
MHRSKVYSTGVVCRSGPKDLALSRFPVIKKYIYIYKIKKKKKYLE